MTELPDGVFRLCLSVLTGGLAGVWLIHDAVMLALRRGDKRDPLVRDKRFGYMMGVVIGVIGVVGTLRFNGLM